MKLLRHGRPGSERPGILDSEGAIRDLSGILTDSAGSSLLPESLGELRQVNPAAFPLVPGSPRLGPCVGFCRQVDLRRPQLFGPCRRIGHGGSGRARHFYEADICDLRPK
jgi:hypothetical protein